jgi:hypothetical protein
MMASHDTGMLEGFVRFALGQPEAFLSPALSLFLFTFAVLGDMIFHQYVPGVFPYSSAVERFGHHGTPSTTFSRCCRSARRLSGRQTATSPTASPSTRS